MGFSGLIAAALIILLASISLSTLAGLVISGVGEVNEAYVSQLEMLSNSVNEKVKIKDALLMGSNRLRLNVTNVGTTSIRVKDFHYIDLIVVYTTTLGSKRVVRLDYDPSGEALDGWHVIRVLVGNSEGDVVNPISLDLQAGLWDPHETIEIEVLLAEDAEATASLAIVFALPNGVRDVYSLGA